MANSSPPWVMPSEFVVTINNTPISPGSSNESAAGGVARYAGNDNSYQTVVQWTVSAGKVGELKEISMISADLTHVFWQVTIGDVVYMSDRVLTSALTLPFGDLKIAEGKQITVECLSGDSSLIVVDASIVAKEISS